MDGCAADERYFFLMFLFYVVCDKFLFPYVFRYLHTVYIGIHKKT